MLQSNDLYDVLNVFLKPFWVNPKICTVRQWWMIFDYTGKKKVRVSVLNVSTSVLAVVSVPAGCLRVCFDVLGTAASFSSEASPPSSWTWNSKRSDVYYFFTKLHRNRMIWLYRLGVWPWHGFFCGVLFIYYIFIFLGLWETRNYSVRAF